jgi:MoxR-like ATPase
MLLCYAFFLQVTNAQIGKLARLAAGRPADSSSSSNGNGSGSSGPALDMEDFRHTADLAYAVVDVPDSVVDILAELRCFLQDKCEPPMYVSDRRFMKAVQMLQVRRAPLCQCRVS